MPATLEMRLYKRLAQRLITLTAVVSTLASSLVPEVSLAAAAAPCPSPTLSANPSTAQVGSPITFTFAGAACNAQAPATTGAFAAIVTFAIDFGDGSPRAPIALNASAVHAYSQPGWYTAAVLAQGQRTVAQTRVTIVRPSASPTPTATAVPPVHIVGLSLSWPNGERTLSLAANALVPRAVALVRVDAPGTVLFQWQLDGSPLTTSTAIISASDVGRAVHVELLSPLPTSGDHRVSISVLTPAPTFAGPTPPPPIQYAYAGIPTPRPVASAFYAGPMPVVRFPRINLANLPLGNIYLQNPRFGIGREGDIFGINFGLPMLDDLTDFEWQEQNPGIADYFELQVVLTDGKTVIAKQRIEKNRRSYTPDIAFLEQVFTKVPSRRGFRVYHMDRLKQQDGDMMWQVQGFARVADDGVAADGTHDRLVEKSDPWPLWKPDDANGAPCGANDNGFAGRGVSVRRVNLDRTSPSDITDYINDHIALDGAVDFSRSPYTAKFTTSGRKEPDQLFGTVDRIKFENAFIDWGDGTVVPLSLMPDRQLIDYRQRSPQATLNLPHAGPVKLFGAEFYTDFTHQYSYAGQYRIRIYQLAESDIQHVDPSDVAASIDGTRVYQAVSYFGALKSANKLQAAPSSPGQRSRFAIAGRGERPSPSQIAARAYTVYCGVADISEGLDPVANSDLHLLSVRVSDFPDHRAAPSLGRSKNAPVRQIAAVATTGPPAGEASTCDSALTADSELVFYGRGDAEVTWQLDGQTLYSEHVHLSSPQAHGLGRVRKKPSEMSPAELHKRAGTKILHSHFLSTKTIGTHKVAIQVAVVPPDPTSPRLGHALAQGLGASSALRPAGGAALPKYGFLSPSKAVTGSMPAVAYLGSSSLGAAMAATLRRGPPNFVESAPAEYKVTPSASNQPCEFSFITKQGAFSVSDLKNLQHSGSTYGGSGILKMRLRQNKSDAADIPVKIAFQNWTVAPDGFTVTSGSIDVAPSNMNDLNTPGTTASLTRISAKTDGKPDYDMAIALDLVLTDQNLRLPDVSQAPPKWSNLQAPVDPDGNWIYPHGGGASPSLPNILLGWSQLELRSPAIVFDFSAKEGNAPSGGCEPGGPEWVGVNLGKAKLKLFTLGFSGTNREVDVDNWAILPEGLCGHLSNPSFNFVASGSDATLRIPSITVDANHSHVRATYENMSVHIPWLDADVKGTATIGDTGEATFPLTSPPVTKNYGPIVMTVDKIAFTAEKNLDWTIGGDAHFDFKNNVAFTHVDVPHMFFTFAGRPAFAEGATDTDVALGGNTKFGDTSVDLKSVHLHAPSSGDDLLAFAFAVQARLSQTIPAADSQVNYNLRKQAGNYVAAQPSMNEFSVGLVFPLGQPVINSQLKPHYIKDGGDDRYEGDVDLGMFGGPPVKAQFLLGFESGSDYWMTRADIGFGSSGIVIVPAIMSLYSIGGGLGYHVRFNDPSDTSNIHKATFDPGSGLKFLANLKVGSNDGGTAYFVDGTFTVTTSGSDAGARMDYKCWIATPDHSSTPLFQGYFQYAGGNFDGGLEGQYNPPGLGGSIYVRVPGPHYGGSSVYAANLHFGGGTWHIYIGQKAGPRVQTHILVYDVTSWLMLDQDGFAIGSGTNIDLHVGDSDVISAYIKGNVEMGLQITYAPHIIGDFTADIEAGGCIAGGCASAHVDAQIHAEATPVSVDARATIGTPWPLPDIHVHVHL